MSSGPGSDPPVTRPLFVLPASARPSMNPHKVRLGRLSGPRGRIRINKERREDSDHLWSGALSKHNARKGAQLKTGVTESHHHQSCRNAEGQSVAVAPETLHVACGSRSKGRQRGGAAGGRVPPVGRWSLTPQDGSDQRGQEAPGVDRHVEDGEELLPLFDLEAQRSKPGIGEEPGARAGAHLRFPRRTGRLRRQKRRV